MSNTLSRLGPGNRMALVQWVVDTIGERDAITEAWAGELLADEDIDHVCRVGTDPSTYAYYILKAIGPLQWSPNIASPGGGGGVTAHSDLTGLAAGNDHTQYQLLSAKDQASGYAGLTLGKLAGVQVPYGAVADTACQGNDSRLWPTDTTADAAKLAALPSNATLTSNLAAKAAVATEQGFMGTPRTLTGAGTSAGVDTAIAADVGADLDTSSATDFNLVFNNGLGRKGCIITVYIGAAGAVTPVQGTGTVTFIPLPGKTAKSAALGGVVQYRKKTHSGAGDVWNVTGTLV